MAEPTYKPVRECANCGVLANSNENQCHVCLSSTFRDRLQCQSCGKLFPTGLCAECVQRHIDSLPMVMPFRHAPPSPRPHEFDFDTGELDDRRPRRDRQRAASRLAGPAISLIVVSLLSLGYWCVCAPVGIVGTLNDQNRQNLPEAQRTLNLFIQVFSIIAVVIVNGFIVISSIQKKNASSYGVTMAAAIGSVIPCCSPCYVLGIPFGIWALIVLLDPEVKRAFES
jgi:hypothetical protein